MLNRKHSKHWVYIKTPHIDNENGFKKEDFSLLSSYIILYFSSAPHSNSTGDNRSCHIAGNGQQVFMAIEKITHIIARKKMCQVWMNGYPCLLIIIIFFWAQELPNSLSHFGRDSPGLLAS